MKATKKTTLWYFIEKKSIEDGKENGEIFSKQEGEAGFFLV